ncbi:hypothetical protein U0070_010264 [Myodes glareolus]|uniref:Reverse transcriptase domain-containing protein n=1 Tax=Myodes glareolus TaxID=447135 RepID=A0AAW0HDK8_MYOGA
MDDMIVYISDPKNSTKELLQLINTFSNVAGYKINSKKSNPHLVMDGDGGGEPRWNTGPSSLGPNEKQKERERIVFGNLLIVITVISDSHLHSPMYFLLANLSFIDLSLSSVTAPKMIADFFCKRRRFYGDIRDDHQCDSGARPVQAPSPRVPKDLAGDIPIVWGLFITGRPEASPGAQTCAFFLPRGRLGRKLASGAAPHLGSVHSPTAFTLTSQVQIS